MINWMNIFHLHTIVLAKLRPACYFPPARVAYAQIFDYLIIDEFISGLWD